MFTAAGAARTAGAAGAARWHTAATGCHRQVLGAFHGEDRLDILLTTTVAVNTKLQDKIEKVLVEQQVEKDAEMAEMMAVSPARSSATYQYGDGSASESSSAPNSTHSTGSAGHPHCLSPAGSLARRLEY